MQRLFDGVFIFFQIFSNSDFYIFEDAQLMENIDLPCWAYSLTQCHHKMLFQKFKYQKNGPFQF